MGQCQWTENATSDRTVYPVHPSRYTISTVDTPPLTDDGEDNDFGFNWDICLYGAAEYLP